MAQTCAGTVTARRAVMTVGVAALTMIGTVVLAPSGGATPPNDSSQPAQLTLTPATAYIVQGGHQFFDVSVTDDEGNAVAGAEVTFTHDFGPGEMSADPLDETTDKHGEEFTVRTDDSGRGEVLLDDIPAQTPSTTVGSITASAATPDNPSTKTSQATSKYLVNTPAKVTAYAARGSRAGTPSFATSLATDSNGVLEKGVPLYFDISGSTTAGGVARTDDHGRARFTFVPQHVGNFTVVVRDGHSPGHTASATSTTAKGIATTELTQISPKRYRIRDTATLSVERAGIQVDFYQRLAGGRVAYRGSAKTNAHGVAEYVNYRIRSGYRYTGIAKVSGSNADFDGPNSKAVTTAVK